ERVGLVIQRDATPRRHIRAVVSRRCEDGIATGHRHHEDGDRHDPATAPEHLAPNVTASDPGAASGRFEPGGACDGDRTDGLERVSLSFVLIEKPRPHVALVTLNRPERMNSMAFDVMIPLRQALETLSHDNDVRVVVLTGAGHGFCSGADLEDAGIVPNIDGLTVTSIARR